MLPMRLDEECELLLTDERVLLGRLYEPLDVLLLREVLWRVYPPLRLDDERSVVMPLRLDDERSVETPLRELPVPCVLTRLRVAELLRCVDAWLRVPVAVLRGLTVRPAPVRVSPSRDTEALRDAEPTLFPPMADPPRVARSPTLRPAERLPAMRGLRSLRREKVRGPPAKSFHP